MILTGNEIIEAHKRGDIQISNFDESKVNPNSYNLTLSPEFAIYNSESLDMASENTLRTFTIPEEGFILMPGELYLARTNEKTVTNNYVPMLEGRSSIGRLGMFIHVTAGFGDIGFNGYWTLEITVVKPLKIYPNTEICQIYYHSVNNDVIGDRTYKSNKYQNNKGIQASQLYKEFETKNKKQPFIPKAGNFYRVPGVGKVLQVIEVSYPRTSGELDRECVTSKYETSFYYKTRKEILHWIPEKSDCLYHLTSMTNQILVICNIIENGNQIVYAIPLNYFN